jgi:hypothetical protein
MALAIASIVLGVAMIAAVPSLRHSVSLVLHGNFTGLRDYIRGLGAGGVALLLALHEPRGLPFTQRCRRMDRRGGDRGTAGRRPFRDQGERYSSECGCSPRSTSTPPLTSL